MDLTSFLQNFWSVVDTDCVCIHCRWLPPQGMQHVALANLEPDLFITIRNYKTFMFQQALQWTQVNTIKILSACYFSLEYAVGQR